ncbi:MAG: tautomerase [Pseudomonadota bacterium]
MPNIFVTLPAGALDAAGKQQLVERINAAAWHAEQIPDDAKQRFLCWVVIDETAPGNWTCGGQDVSARFVPVLVQVNVPAGVLDAGARAGYTDGIQAGLLAVLGKERRRLVTSVIFNEVPDGQWAVNGALWRLPDFAAGAGYRHLQHLVVAWAA